MKLDRTKPFGTVFGGAGHAFEQDGKYFDHEGNLVPQDEPEAAKAEDKPAKASKTTKAPAEAAKAEDPQLSAQLGDA